MFDFFKSLKKKKTVDQLIAPFVINKNRDTIERRVEYLKEIQKIQKKSRKDNPKK